jgi:pyruvate ferredoxin oxidoreductase delta subunit
MSEKESLAERMKLPWKQMPITGAMLQPGSATEYRTGDWRVAAKPVIDLEKCIMCLFCWIFCPDSSIVRTDESVEVDYYHCKGCGICAVECPVNAIEMVEE